MIPASDVDTLATTEEKLYKNACLLYFPNLHRNYFLLSNMKPQKRTTSLLDH